MPNAIEALLDRRKARVDRRLELRVGENVGPVVFDAFANKLADIEWIDAGLDAPAVPFLRQLNLRQQVVAQALEARGLVPLRGRDLGANEAEGIYGDSRFNFILGFTVTVASISYCSSAERLICGVSRLRYVTFSRIRG